VEPTFSICIPNYNYENLIGLTIQSVLDQTHKEFEVVIMDNASTDRSWEVISDFAARDKRVKPFRNKYNVGFSPNIDRAVNKASNEYILVLSSDDIMHPDALATYRSIILAMNEADRKNMLLCCSLLFIDQHGQEIQKWGKQETVLNFQEEKPAYTLADSITVYEPADVLRKSIVRFHNPCGFLCTMYHRNVYERVSGYSSVSPMGPDAVFVYKALSAGVKYVYCDQYLFSYRIHQGGQQNLQTANLKVTHLADKYILINLFDAEMKKHGIDKQDMIRFYCNEFITRESLRELAKGRYMYALRHLLFGVATYPSACLRDPGFFPALLAILLGPLGKLLIRSTVKRNRAA
jgi:glycosyltransferase involved in cell wall biosynthesis